LGRVLSRAGRRDPILKESAFRPFLRDGVDVYLSGAEELHFVFLASRKRIVVRATPALTHAVGWLDGSSTLDDLQIRVSGLHGEHAGEQLRKFVSYLQLKGIVVDENWQSTLGLDAHTRERQARQLTFLLDVLESPEKVADAQNRIAKTRIACFGVGAMGSWIVRQLLDLGFRDFVLVDFDKHAASDVSRHAFSSSDDRHEFKVVGVANAISRDFPGVQVQTFTAPLSTATRLDQFIDPGVSLVINTADHPYIGYSSVLLSRYCVPRALPLVVAGGFDAHLGSLGELLVPGVTPCADCYASFFEEALANWKPLPHPVEDRSGSFGGLCGLSVFSAAASVMKIVHHVALDFKPSSGRGELIFHDYHLESFEVSRRPDCAICGRT
jgi:molybdopterin/thiamine biosynthesis adenylyltransferase